MSESKLRVVVVGAGQMGAVHARAWAAVVGEEAVGLLVRNERDHERWDQAGFSEFSRVDAAIAWPQTVQFASVCTPTNSHTEVALMIVGSGVHALVEKPLAGSLIDAKALVDAKAGRCFVASTCRAESTTMAALAAVGTRPVTRIDTERAECARPLPDATPKLAHHGRLLDVLVHDLGALIALLPDDSPRGVVAVWDDNLKALDATLSWPDVSVRLRQRQAAEFSERAVRIEGGDTAWGWQLSPGKRSTWRQQAGGQEELAHSWEDPTTNIVREVVAAVRDGRPCPFDAASGLRAMELAALVMNALPAEVFGGRFSWDYVR